MKTMMWIVGVSLLFAIPAKGQFFNSSHVPEGAKIAFHSQYPKAKHISWLKDKEAYEVRFLLHNTAYSVLYDEEGAAIAEVVRIKKINLPRRAKKQLHDNYASFSVKDALRIRSFEGKVVYGIHIGRAEEEYDMVFNENGYVLTVLPGDAPITVRIAE